MLSMKLCHTSEHVRAPDAVGTYKELSGIKIVIVQERLTFPVRFLWGEFLDV